LDSNSDWSSKQVATTAVLKEPPNFHNSTFWKIFCLEQFEFLQANIRAFPQTFTIKAPHGIGPNSTANIMVKDVDIDEAYETPDTDTILANYDLETWSSNTQPTSWTIQLDGGTSPASPSQPTLAELWRHQHRSKFSVTVTAEDHTLQMLEVYSKAYTGSLPTAPTEFDLSDWEVELSKDIHKKAQYGSTVFHALIQHGAGEYRAIVARFLDAEGNPTVFSNVLGGEDSTATNVAPATTTVVGASWEAPVIGNAGKDIDVGVTINWTGTANSVTAILSVTRNSAIKKFKLVHQFDACTPYAAGTAYLAGAIVLYSNLFWKNLIGCTGVTPVEGANWTQLDTDGTTLGGPEVVFGNFAKKGTSVKLKGFASYFEATGNVVIGTAITAGGSLSPPTAPTLGTAVHTKNGTMLPVTLPDDASAGVLQIFQANTGTTGTDPVTAPASWDKIYSQEIIDEILEDRFHINCQLTRPNAYRKALIARIRSRYDATLFSSFTAISDGGAGTAPSDPTVSSITRGNTVDSFTVSWASNTALQYLRIGKGTGGAAPTHFKKQIEICENNADGTTTCSITSIEVDMEHAAGATPTWYAKLVDSNEQPSGWAKHGTLSAGISAATMTNLSVALTLTASGGTPFSGPQYKFEVVDWGDGDFEAQVQAASPYSGFSHAYASAGNYLIEIKVTDAVAATDTTSVTVLAVVGSSLPPTVSVNTMFFEIDSGGSISITATATGGTAPYVDYDWFWGDGVVTMDGGVTPSRAAWNTPGSFNGSVRVKDTAGEYGWAFFTVKVRQLISVALNALAFNGASPFTPSITATITGGTAPYAYRFQWGDGSADTLYSGASPHTEAAHVYTWDTLSGGDFSGTVFVTDANGLVCMATFHATATNPCSGSITPRSVTGTGSATQIFAVAYAGFSGTVNYDVDFGDGVGQLTAQTAGATPFNIASHTWYCYSDYMIVYPVSARLYDAYGHQVFLSASAAISPADTGWVRPNAGAQIGTVIQWKNTGGTAQVDEMWDANTTTYDQAALTAAYPTSRKARLTWVGSLITSGTPTGVSVEVTLEAASVSIVMFEVYLMKNTLPVGDPKYITVNGSEVVVLGGRDDKWGTGITLAEMNSATFGVQIKAIGDGSAAETPKVKDVRIKGHYNV
jgi:hypothetical protein